MRDVTLVILNSLRIKCHMRPLNLNYDVIDVSIPSKAYFRFTQHPARISKYFFTKCNCCFCVFRQLMNCKSYACRFVPMSIAHKIVPRSRFVHNPSLDCAQILVVHA